MCNFVIRDVFEGLRDQESDETLYELEKIYDFNHAGFVVEYPDAYDNKMMWVLRNEPWYLYKLKDQFE